MTARNLMAAPRERILGRLALVALLVGALGPAGCGVGPTDRPVDEGDPVAVEGGADTATLTLPKPDDTASPDGLVRNFLQVAAGGFAGANDRMKAFLTPKALATWQDPVPAENPPITLIRIESGPTVGAGPEYHVTLEYQVIGLLTDQGRVDDLVPSATHQLTFTVVANQESATLRIDALPDWPGGLLLSDEGLRNYYQIQPIYFWDNESNLLVPDIRYVPLTEGVDLRAKQILAWLVAGPSAQLGSSVQRLPNGSAAGNVLTQDDGTLTVELTAATAGTGDAEALRRLMYQLQWSLTSLAGADIAPRIELRLDGQATPVDVKQDDFRRFNHSYAYAPRPIRYEISADHVVVPVESDDPHAPVLADPGNSQVLSAAISRDGDLAAFVRGESASRASLRIARRGASFDAHVPGGSTIGRPSFVPETEFVLVPVGGTLLAVSTMDGNVTEVSHTLRGVTSAAVSPDGRRVAVVAGGEVSVYALVVGNNRVSLASNQRQLLADRLTARTVAWTSESWLLVAGTNGSGQALWRVGADSVLAEDLSGTLLDLSVLDLVCYPQWSGATRWTTRAAAYAYAVTPRGVYNYNSHNAFEYLTGSVNPVFAS